jgi:chemosensory pili system protein ChpA (sensor histidine kinase/response regulator)
LLEELEGSLCLTEDVENNLMSEVEPVFAALNQHLELLVNRARSREKNKGAGSPRPFLPEFKSKVLEQLRLMLQLFKQLETTGTRQQLQECCYQLLQLGKQFNLPGWCTLCETVSGAISDGQNKYRTLAPIVIKELKQSQELVIAGREAEITISEQLQALSGATFLIDWEDTNARKLNENDLLVNETKEPSASLGLETDAEINFIQASGDTSRDVSSVGFFNETLALDSLFDEAEDTSLSKAYEEPDFGDLFAAPAAVRVDVPEESAESLEILKISPEPTTEDEDDLFAFWEEEPEAKAQTQFESEFSLFEDADDNLFEELSTSAPFTLSQTELKKTAAHKNVQSDDSFNDLGKFDSTFDDLWDEQADTRHASATAVPIDPTAAFDSQNDESTAAFDFIHDLIDATVETGADFSDSASDILFNKEAAEEVGTATEVADNLEDFAEWDEFLAESAPSVTTSAIRGEGKTETALSGDSAIAAQAAARMKPNSQPAAADLPRARAPLEQMMRVPIKQLDNVSNLVGEMVVYRNTLEQDQERLRQFLDNLLHQMQHLGNVSSRMQELYEQSLLEASLINSRQGSQSTFTVSSGSNSESHVTGMKFNALEMDRFTGFHSLAQEIIELIVRVRESSSDIEFITDEIDQVARQFRQVTNQLQEGLMRSRMVPFAQIADRLPRAVRDISLKYGKQAALQIEGWETLIDKVILEQLYDPMTHLVNNAITHGIETAEERVAHNKSPIGQITIRAFLQGNQTVISVADDGAGIDSESVKAKAIQKGLIAPEMVKTMSCVDVYNLLFSPGFSTKDQVDDFAGRGVGMDVVRTSLSKMQGAITIDSTLGKGTTFTIRLPLTLSICKALCCVSDKARIAFPMNGVEQMIDIPVKNVITEAQGQSCISWRGSLLPFRPLKELLTYNCQLSRSNVYGGNREDDIISIVVLRSAGTFIGIQVDQVLGEQEIVIKRFEGPAPKPVGVAGATILGDGRIVPIADVLELIDLSMGRLQQKGSEMLSEQSAAPVMLEKATLIKTEPTVLLVDDSITVRELLSMTFNNAGYRVEQARDGQEAWEKLCDGLPCDIVFCDIEMPRMDGLELLSRMQKDPKLSHLPIAMLTSRGADRHRQMAVQLGASGYITKPYLEEALLDAAQRMLKGEVLVTTNK